MLPAVGADARTGPSVRLRMGAERAEAGIGPYKKDPGNSAFERRPWMRASRGAGNGAK